MEEFIWTKELNNIESFHGERILVADDNDLNVQVLQIILEDKGIVVDVAYDGEETVKAYLASEEYTYSAILMDINMAGMNGFEATERIRSAGRKDSSCIAICAISADVMPEPRRRAREAGMNQFLEKPIDYIQLFQYLHDAIQQRE